MSARAVPTPGIPSLDHAALLLDFDGTLVDIAATPGAVVIEPGLVDVLAVLRRRLGDALAIVTGRPLGQLDALLPGSPYAVAGEHGGALRRHPGARIEHPSMPALPTGWLAEAAGLVHAHPGALVEPKSHGLVLHYRAAPDAGPALYEAATALVSRSPGSFVVSPAKMAWEIRPAGVDKGTAVEALMAEPPFAGRLPVFVGDDVTDLDGIAAAIRLGGVGLMVPDAFIDPAGVRRWLASLAA